MLYQWIVSIVRTIVPAAAGWIAVQAARLGVSVDDATVASALTAVVGVAYYAIARYFEERWPRWGWLLGAPRRPRYEWGDGR